MKQANKSVIMHGGMNRKVSFTQKHYHFNFLLQSLSPPPRPHSPKLPKQKSHGEAQFDDEEKDENEWRDGDEERMSKFYHKSDDDFITKAP